MRWFQVVRMGGYFATTTTQYRNAGPKHDTPYHTASASAASNAGPSVSTISTSAGHLLTTETPAPNAMAFTPHGSIHVAAQAAPKNGGSVSTQYDGQNNQSQLKLLVQKIFSRPCTSPPDC